MTPSSRLIVLLSVCALPVLLMPFGMVENFAALAPTVATLIFAIGDRIWGTDTKLEVSRQLTEVFSLGTQNKVVLRIGNVSNRKITIDIADGAPDEGKAVPEVLSSLEIAGFSKHEATYQFVPDRRGELEFDGIHVRHPSRLGLWAVSRVFPTYDKVRVYPNIQFVRQYDLMAQQNNLTEMGIRMTRKKGQGLEFERLREYRPNDDPRAVDWKTTARLGKLIVREMGDERNQNLVFLIDVGRMMRQRTDGLSHFDYALNTAIALGHIAQKKGDHIGAMLFSDRVLNYIPLTRGNAAVDRIVHAGYNLESEEVATNYDLAFRYLMTRLTKRSMIILMTHLVEGEDQRLIETYSRMLARQHLPVCLFFREPSLEKVLSARSTSLRNLYTKSAAAQLWMERESGLSALRQAGVIAIDAKPGEYSSVAVNKYLEIKARHLL